MNKIKITIVFWKDGENQNAKSNVQILAFHGRVKYD